MYTLRWQGEFILASSSPRRRELLAGLGLPFRVLSADVDERILDSEDARSMVLRLAEKKSAAVASQFPDALVLGADTTVELNGAILGKPVSAQDAEAMLARISGKEHRVFTACALQCAARKISERFVDESFVKIAALSATEIAAYVAGGEPMDKAGSYAAQGQGAAFVEYIRGSYSNVVGLPLAALISELKRMHAIGVEGV